MNAKRVLVIQRRMTHYRIPFFEELKKICDSEAIELTVAYGVGTQSEQEKNDAAELSWGVKIDTTYFLNGKICWQPFGSLLKNKDVIVVTQENKLIYNFFVQFLNKKIKFIYWGHGANLQGNPQSISEIFKKKLAAYADWWLGYTSHSLQFINAFNYPESRVTILNNSVDTKQLSQYLSAVTELEKTSVRDQFSLSDSIVGIYIGSLYDEKKIDFMLQSAVEIQKKIPNFKLLVIGKGIDDVLVKQHESEYDFIKCLGVKTGHEKAIYLSISHIMLNPGLVGLGILDSFVAGVPMFTTDCGLHSPEIVYLENRVNGVMTDFELDKYVKEVVYFCQHKEEMLFLKENCINSGHKYSVHNMASNFFSGILGCLGRELYR